MYPLRSSLKNPLKSLRLKSVLTLLFFFFLASAFGAKLLVDFQTRQLLKQADKEAGSLAAMASDDINDAMMKGSLTDTWKSLDKAAQDGKNKVWLTDDSGMVVASSVPEDVGKKGVDLFEIRNGGISDILKKGPMAGTRGDYILSRSVTIHKKPECAGCHYRDSNAWAPSPSGYPTARR